MSDDSISNARFASISSIDVTEIPPQGIDYKRFSTVSNTDIKGPLQETNCVFKNITDVVYNEEQSMSNGNNV